MSTKLKIIEFPSRKNKNGNNTSKSMGLLSLRTIFPQQSVQLMSTRCGTLWKFFHRVSSKKISLKLMEWTKITLLSSMEEWSSTLVTLKLNGISDLDASLCFRDYGETKKLRHHLMDCASWTEKENMRPGLTMHFCTATSLQWKTTSGAIKGLWLSRIQGRMKEAMFVSLVLIYSIRNTFKIEASPSIRETGTKCQKLKKWSSRCATIKRSTQKQETSFSLTVELSIVTPCRKRITSECVPTSACCLGKKLTGGSAKGARKRWRTWGLLATTQEMDLGLSKKCPKRWKTRRFLDNW